MHVRRYSLFVLALVVSACASSPDTPVGEDFETAPEAMRGNSNLIVRAELEQLTGQSNAWEAVEVLRPLWLRRGRGGVLPSGPTYARVVIDVSRRGELDDLRSISTDNIESLRFLSAIDATTKYGTGYLGGVIEVTTRGR